jgi:hypothetical protein
VAAASADADLAKAGIGWTRNTDSYSSGTAYAWGIKAGNDKLIDAVNQGIVAAWQGNVIAGAYAKAFPGANSSVLTAPGPTAVGTSYGSSKDYVFRNMWFPGPWSERTDWMN